ncbi:MAG: GNAT family N-acetyltransferase [Defluviitaleaceae bacterium]|nr:GNAT family N-acetyltransferase [Defluviitaleaceae bacterium]
MVRAMEAADIPRVAEIHVHAQRVAYRGIFSDEWLFGETTVIGRIAEFERWFAAEGSEGFVFDNGIITGFIMMGPCPDKDKVPHGMELERIFVDPFMQGQGLGKILIEHCDKIAKKRGFTEVCLWVLEDNVNAQAFYVKNGYALDGAREYLANNSVTQVRYVRTIGQ